MSDLELTSPAGRERANAPQMTVTGYLKLVAAGDREADEMVSREIPGDDCGSWGCAGIPRKFYATAGLRHATRWVWFGEMVDALADKIPKLTVGHALGLVAAIMSEQGVTANAAAAAALLFTTEPSKED